MKLVTIHTDGGCEPNPGPGGWAAVIETGGHLRELSGGSPATTNNRMEMQAAIEALRVLPEPCRVELFTDSQYLRQGVCEWLRGWKARGWQTVEKQPVKNQDLWQQLDALVAGHTMIGAGSDTLGTGSTSDAVRVGRGGNRQGAPAVPACTTHRRPAVAGHGQTTRFEAGCAVLEQRVR